MIPGFIPSRGGIIETKRNGTRLFRHNKQKRFPVGSGEIPTSSGQPGMVETPVFSKGKCNSPRTRGKNLRMEKGGKGEGGDGTFNAAVRARLEVGTRLEENPNKDNVETAPLAVLWPNERTVSIMDLQQPGVSSLTWKYHSRHKVI